MAKIKTLTLEETLSKLAPIKADLEAKFNSGNKWTQNAVKRDLDLVNAKIQSLQQHNESLIAQKQQQTEFRRGGVLPKYSGEDVNNTNPFTGEPIISQVPPTSAYSQFMPQRNNMQQSAQQSVPFDFPTHIQPAIDTANSATVGYRQMTQPYSNMQGEPPRVGTNWANNTGDFIKNNQKGIGLTAATLAPIGYNFMEGMKTPISYTPAYNPEDTYSKKLYQESINRNIGEQLQANQRGASNLSAISRDASQGHGGNYMAMNMAIQNQKQVQDTNAYEWKANAEAQAKANAAQGIHGIGQGVQQENQRIQNMNEMARANTENFTKAGWEQLGSAAQQWQVGNNQKDRDSNLISMMNKTYPALMRYYKTEDIGRMKDVLTPEEFVDLGQAYETYTNPESRAKIQKYNQRLGIR